MKKYRYFSDDEVRRVSFSLQPLSPTAKIDDIMSPSFMRRLETARELAGVPFVLTCAYRSIEYDRSKGRTGLSYHCRGRAVDIACCYSNLRYIIVKALQKAGFSSIGIAKTFIHVDDRGLEFMEPIEIQQIFLYDE